MSNVKTLVCAWILGAAAFGAFGCASGDSTGGGTGTGNPTPAGSTTPAPDKAPATGSGSKAASGPNCSAYYGSGGCCETLAAGIAQAKDACAQAKKAIDDGLAAGGHSADYESACKQANDLGKQLGKCK